MTKIRVPYTLTADNSEKYNVSIRLWPGGLSFSGYVPMDENSFFLETILFADDVPTIQALKDVFFANECLSYVYHSLYVVFVYDKYTLVPDSVFSEKDKDTLFSYCHPIGKDEKVLAQPLKRLYSSLLFSVDADIYEFLSRSLVNPQFIHTFSPMIIAWQKKSLPVYPKQMYVVLREKAIDIVCYKHGEILFVNSFDAENENDIIYYIMYVWKQLSMEQIEDNMYITGDKEKAKMIEPRLRTYIENVEILPVKMSKYITALDQDLYLDIAILTECGL